MIYNAPLSQYNLKGQRGFLFCNECERLLGYCYVYNNNRDDSDRTHFEYAVTNKAPYGYKINGHYDHRHGNSDDWFDRRCYFVT